MLIIILVRVKKKLCPVEPAPGKKFRSRSRPQVDGIVLYITILSLGVIRIVDFHISCIWTCSETKLLTTNFYCESVVPKFIKMHSNYFSVITSCIFLADSKNMKLQYLYIKICNILVLDV